MTLALADISRAICCGPECRTRDGHCHAPDHMREAERVMRLFEPALDAAFDDGVRVGCADAWEAIDAALIAARQSIPADVQRHRDLQRVDAALAKRLGESTAAQAKLMAENTQLQRERDRYKEVAERGEWLGDIGDANGDR